MLFSFLIVKYTLSSRCWYNKYWAKIYLEIVLATAVSYFSPCSICLVSQTWLPHLPWKFNKKKTKNKKTFYRRKFISVCIRDYVIFCHSKIIYNNLCYCTVILSQPSQKSTQHKHNIAQHNHNQQLYKN